MSRDTQNITILFITFFCQVYINTRSSVCTWRNKNYLYVKMFHVGSYVIISLCVCHEVIYSSVYKILLVSLTHLPYCRIHYDDVIMTMLASQITSLAVVYSIVYSGVNQRKHQSSASLAFVREIHRGPVNFPHKWPVTRKMFPFDDVIMYMRQWIGPALVPVMACRLN